jgi:hypothetical protein
LEASNSERLWHATRERMTVAQTVGEQAESEREQAEIAAIRPMAPRAERITSPNHTEVDHPQIGERGGDPQSSKSVRVALQPRKLI